jgi:hypothetical protein
VRAGRIAARRPSDVAREVERLRREGCVRYTLSSLDAGGTLDLERLGAARYAAGLHAEVGLEDRRPAAVSR